MTKTLFLVRHAKSDWGHPMLSDFDRPLNKRGLRDAPDMGQRLKHSGRLPDRIVCSTARRARETLNGLNLNIDHIRYEERIYEASADTLLSIIQEQDDACDALMLIGHNPGMSWLTSELSGHYIGNLPTGAIAVIALDTDTWGAAGTCQAQLLALDKPKNA